MSTVREEHDSAVKRLDAAVAEQDRLQERHDAAMGTSGELSAAVQLSAATADATARDAWLKWVDDERYRGLNAGPFALRGERDDHLVGPTGASGRGDGARAGSRGAYTGEVPSDPVAARQGGEGVTPVTNGERRPHATPDVSIWPEERLREELDANGETTREVATLLTEFGAERLTPAACRNISKQLHGVGIVIEPPLAEAERKSQVTLRIRSTGGDG